LRGRCLHTQNAHCRPAHQYGSMRLNQPHS
jgi:hypothetical protein